MADSVAGHSAARLTSASSSTIESRPPDSATAIASGASRAARACSVTRGTSAARTAAKIAAAGWLGWRAAAPALPPRREGSQRSGSAGGELLELAIVEDLVLARFQHRVAVLL